MEFRLRHKQGRIIDVLFGAARLDPNDPSKGYTFTALDITAAESRDREELAATKGMLEAAIAQSPAGIYDRRCAGCQDPHGKPGGL